MTGASDGPGPKGRLLRLVRGLGQGLAALLGLALLGVASGLVLASQTATGRQAAADFLESTLAGAVDGRVEVGRITGGNLLTRAVVERLRIGDAGGEPFLALRDVRVEYSPFGFLTGDVHLRRLRAGRLELTLRQGSDGRWNFDRIFGDGTPDDTATSAEEGGLRLRVTDADVEGGRIEVRTPWDGGPDPETIWRLEEESGRTVRVIALEELSGSLPLLRLADPDRPMRIEAADVRARALAVDQPLPVERLDAVATFGDTVRVELPAVRTARSRLSGAGRVLPGDPVRFRFELEADTTAFAELRWLPVPVPSTGGAEGRLVLRTAADPEITAVDVTGGVFRSGVSRAEGRFTLYLEDTPRLEDVDLAVRPLELALWRELTGGEEGPDGTVEGTVAGGGPIDLFRIDASLVLRRPPGEGPSPGAPADSRPSSGPSRVELDGGLGLVGDPRALSGLEVTLEGFEPRWTRLIGIDTRQDGRADGRATLDRTPGGRVSFTADLRHVGAGGEASRVSGQGSLRPGDPARVDLRLRTRPLSLSLLDPWFPTLEMTGTVRGPLTLAGTMGDLEASAELETPRGRIEFDGRFDLAARRKAYDARLTAREIQLQQWLREGPRSSLDVTGRVRGRGTDPDSLDAEFDLELLPSRFQGARLDTSLLRFTVREGRASIDTFAVRSDVGTLRGRGGIGLGAGQTGSLFLDLEAPDLSEWNRWVVPGRRADRDTTARDLFAAFPELEGEADGGGEAAAPDTLAGALSVRGVVEGNLTAFGFGGSVAGRGLRWGRASADSLQVTVNTSRVRSLDSLTVAGRGRGVGWGVHRVDSASFRLEPAGEGRARVRVAARREERGAAAIVAGVTRTEARTEARLDSLVLETARQRLRLTGPATVAHGDSGLVVRGLELRGEEGGRLRADGEVPLRGEASLDVTLRELDLGGLAGMVRPGTALRGTATGSGRMRGTAAAPILDLDLGVSGPGWGTLAYDSLALDLSYRDRRLEGGGALLHGGRELVRAEGRLLADLSLRNVEDRISGAEDPLSATVRADSLPLELLLLPTEMLRDARGAAVGRIAVRGSPGSPRLDGELEIRRGGAFAAAVGVNLTRVGGHVSFRDTEARIDSLRMASSRGGTSTVHGTVDLSDVTDPAFDLEIRARDFHGIDRRRASLKIDGRGRLGGSYRRPELTGDVRLFDGTVRVQELLRQGQVVDLTDPELYGLMDTTALAERRILARVRDPFMENLSADLSVTLGPDLWIRSPQISVEVAGDIDVRMDRARGDLAAFGPVRLVRGTYRFTGARGVVSRQLRITGGRIEFVGTPGGNPNLDITAVHRVRQEDGTIRVEAHVTGTMLDPTLGLTSDPPLSESDQVCVLLINSLCGSPQAGQLARSQLLGRVGAELSSVLASEVGFDYLELRGGSRRADGGEEDGTAAAEEGSFLGQAEIEAGWYLSPELFLTVTYPVGNRFPAGTLDWRFSENWSVELLSELRYGRGLRAGAASNLERERTWGLFLFREWSF